jgi:SiaC family regulatory phosphoprotein
MPQRLYIPHDYKKLTPEIVCDVSETFAYMTISGESNPEDVQAVFAPFWAWFESVKESDLNVHIAIDLHYFNTSTSKELHEILEQVLNIHKHTSRQVMGLWLYQADDEDMYESGTIYFAQWDTHLYELRPKK